MKIQQVQCNHQPMMGLLECDSFEDSALSLVDKPEDQHMVRKRQQVHAEFLSFVQERQTKDDDDSLLLISQLSLLVNDSASGKSFDQVFEKGPVLGEGGFAFVYQCTRREQQQQQQQHASGNCSRYAVKEVLHHDYGQGEELKEEIAALKLFTEFPHIVRLLDVYQERDRTLLVMERMRGGDLLDKLEEIEVYPEKEARQVARTLLEAIAYCHKKHMAHRDIKPENVLLVHENDLTTIKLADFGCAKKFIPGEYSLSTMCGSPQYVAPEVVGDREGGYDQLCDLWSVGVVLYILLGGYAPFEAENEFDLLELILEGDYEFHEDYWMEISDAPKQLIQELLQVDPNERMTAEQALNSDWLRRRDREIIRQGMNESQSSSFQSWLGHRQSSHRHFQGLNDSLSSMAVAGDTHDATTKRQQQRQQPWNEDSSASLNSFWAEGGETVEDDSSDSFESGSPGSECERRPME